MTRDKLLFYFTAFMITCYLVANVMAVKVIHIFGVSIFDAGTIIYPLTYLMVNIITEIWNYQTTRRVVFTALGAQIVFCAFAFLGTLMPYPPEPEYEGIAVAYNTLFTFQGRIMLASIVGFATGELLNAYSLQKIKEFQKRNTNWPQYLWIRTISSSAMAYVIDTTIFVCIAFTGVMTMKEVMSMIVIKIGAKILCELLINTPMVYLIAGQIRKHVSQ